MPRCARSPAIELALDVRLDQRESRRATVDDATDRRPVRLAERRHAEQLAERIACHRELGTRSENAAEFSTSIHANPQQRGEAVRFVHVCELHDFRFADRAAAHREAGRRVDRRRGFGGVRCADVSRCAHRSVGEIRPARARHALGVRAQPQAGVGLVCGAPRAGPAGRTECRARGARANRGAGPRVPARDAERRRAARPRGQPQPRRAARQYRARSVLARRIASSRNGTSPAMRCRRDARRAARSCVRTSSGSRKCCPPAHWNARKRRRANATC